MRMYDLCWIWIYVSWYGEIPLLLVGWWPIRGMDHQWLCVLTQSVVALTIHCLTAFVIYNNNDTCIHSWREERWKEIYLPECEVSLLPGFSGSALVGLDEGDRPWRGWLDCGILRPDFQHQSSIFAVISVFH